MHIQAVFESAARWVDILAEFDVVVFAGLKDRFLLPDYLSPFPSASQNRYKSILCEEEAYLLELTRYIHLNPLRAGIVEFFGGIEAISLERAWCDPWDSKTPGMAGH